MVAYHELYADVACCFPNMVLTYTWALQECVCGRSKFK